MKADWRLHPWSIHHHVINLVRVRVSVKVIVLSRGWLLNVAVIENGLVHKFLHRVGQILRGFGQLLHTSIQRVFSALFWALADRLTSQVYRLAHRWQSTSMIACYAILS